MGRVALRTARGARAGPDGDAAQRRPPLGGDLSRWVARRPEGRPEIGAAGNPKRKLTSSGERKYHHSIAAAPFKAPSTLPSVGLKIPSALCTGNNCANAIGLDNFQ